MSSYRYGGLAVVIALLLFSTLSFAQLNPEYELSIPTRYTSHPAEDYMPTISPDGSMLVFVSNRSGTPNLWIKTLTTHDIPTPRRLTENPSGDKYPAFSPNGKYLSYVSYGADAEGDLYLMKLPRKVSSIAADPPSAIRLSGLDTADREPVFTSDSKGIIFVSSIKPHEENTLWLYDINSGKKRKLLEGPAISPTVSPDGDSVVFVKKSSDISSLYRLNLSNNKVERLSEGWIDTFPEYTNNNSIIFVRYTEDTNRDGAITIDDRPGLYSLDLSKTSPPIPLTGTRAYNLFPIATTDKVFYSAKSGKSVDIFSINHGGAAESLDSLAEDYKRATAWDSYFANNNDIKKLGWSVAWAANVDSGDKDTLLAESLYRYADILRNQGDVTSSSIRFKQVAKLYPDSKPWAAWAKISAISIDSVSETTIVERIKRESGKYKDDREIQAFASVEIAQTYLRAGNISKALKKLRSVVSSYKDLPRLSAKAAYLRNAVYEKLGNREKQILVSVDLIRGYPNQYKWVELAESKIIELTILPGDIKSSSRRLLMLSEKYPDLPSLAAAANNEIGKLYSSAGEYSKARDIYESTLKKYPKQERAISSANFAIARMYSEEENYSEALKMYRGIQKDTEEKRVVYQKARRLYIEQALKKGEYEFSQGEVRIALKTYLSLIEYGPYVVEAHRGLIRCRVALGEVDRLVKEYDSKRKERTPDAVTLYALGLSKTYLNPPPLESSEALIKEALSEDEKNPWFHQTLGWIYEQKADQKNDSSWTESALQEYHYALALTDEKKSHRQYADLALNLGNVSYRLGDCSEAIDFYQKREKAGYPFSDRRVEALFKQRWGECAFRLGDDKRAIERFDQALRLIGDSDDYRELELAERKGLAFQSMLNHGKAAGSFLHALRLRKKIAPKDSHTLTLRNIANNFYLKSKDSNHPRGDQATALSWYLKAEASLDDYRVEEIKTTGSGLFNIDVRTGVGGPRVGARGFSKEEEEKLIYHHIGQIYGDLGDYSKATFYFEKKLEMVPSGLPLLENTPVLTEKAIVLNQLGVWLASLGDSDEAAKRLIESIDICIDLKNVSCATANGRNLGKLSLKETHKNKPWISEAITRLDRAIEMIMVEGASDAIGTAIVLSYSGQLHYQNLLNNSSDKTNLSPADYRESIREVSNDVYLAKERYEMASEMFMAAGEVGSAKGDVFVNLSQAALEFEIGNDEIAINKINESIADARSYGIPEALWQALMIKSMVVTGEKPDEYLSIANLLMTIPFGVEGGGAKVYERSLAKNVFRKLAEHSLISGEYREALKWIEIAALVDAKLSFGGLSELDIGFESSSPLSILLDTFKKRNLAITMAFANIDGAKEEMSLWEEEYQTVLDSIEKSDPFLSWLVDSNRFNLDDVLSSLNEGEASVRLWEREDGKKLLFVATKDGVSGKEYESVDAAYGAIIKLTGLGVEKLFLSSDNVFTDKAPDVVHENFTLVSMVPGMAFIKGAKDRQSLNDYRVTVAGDIGKGVRSATERYRRKRFVTGAKAERVIQNDRFGAGITVFANAPRSRLESPFSASFSLGFEGERMVWLPAATILSRAGAGAAIITPPIKGATDGTGLFTLSLLANFPSWVVTPDKPQKKDEFIETTLALLPDTFVGEAVAIAESEAGAKGRLIGAFGLTAAERTSYARENFVNKVRAGMGYVATEEWAKAYESLNDGRRFAVEGRITKYDRQIYKALSEVVYRLGKYKEAYEYQQKLNSILSDSGDDAALAESLTLTGETLARLNRYPEAVEAIETAVSIYRNLGMYGKMADAVSQLGIAEENNYRYAAALGSFGVARSVRKGRGETQYEGVALGRMGRVYLIRLNDFAKARGAFNEAKKLFEKASATADVVRTKIDLGLVENDAGNFVKSKKLLTEAISGATKIENKELVAEARLHLANVAWFSGEYQDAFSFARLSIKEFTDLKDLSGLSRANNTLGLIYWSVNDHVRALEALTRSLTLAAKESARLDEASALNNIGLVYRSLGELDKAIDYFHRAKAKDEEMGSAWGIAYSLRNLSITHLLQGKLDVSLDEAKKTVFIAEKIGDKVNLAKALLQEARVLSAKNEPNNAMEKYLAAEKLGDDIGVVEVVWRSLRGRASILAKKGKKDEAVKTYVTAVDIVEKMRGSVSADELKSGFLDDKQSLYEELILQLLDSGDIKRSFEYTERARARGFLDLLGTKKISFKDRVSQKSYDKVIKLKSKIAELKKTETVSEKDRRELEKRREAAVKELAESLEKTRIDHPDLLPFVSVESVDVETVALALDAKTALIEYLVTKNELVIFVVSDNDVKVHRRKISRADIQKKVMKLRHRIQDGAPISDEPAILGDLLISPVWESIKGKDSVGIAPHGPLHYLSFAAVNVDGAPLVEHLPLFYVPSASLFVRSAQLRTSAGKREISALAVGDPDIGGSDYDLPLSGLEAESLKWTFENVKVLVKKEATESAVSKGANNYQIVHIASHGLFDASRPLDSALLLAPDSKSDGRLTAAEVFSLSLKADLVTLSACQTGLGKVSRGDEIVGLNRAFMFAGARSVVSTLWRVDDMASALLIKKFYRKLIKEDKATALRAAQLEIRKLYPHPSYWAGFVLVGDYK